MLKALANCFIVYNTDSVGITISYKCSIFFIWNYKLDLPKIVIDGVFANTKGHFSMHLGGCVIDSKG